MAKYLTSVKWNLIIIRSVGETLQFAIIETVRRVKVKKIHCLSPFEWSQVGKSFVGATVAAVTTRMGIYCMEDNSFVRFIAVAGLHIRTLHQQLFLLSSPCPFMSKFSLFAVQIIADCFTNLFPWFTKQCNCLFQKCLKVLLHVIPVHSVQQQSHLKNKFSSLLLWWL